MGAVLFCALLVCPQCFVFLQKVSIISSYQQTNLRYSFAMHVVFLLRVSSDPLVLQRRNSSSTGDCHHDSYIRFNVFGGYV